jgi:hypothetical protein
MVVNRYTQAPVAVYNPMSMQELAFAPTFLRQRHDQAAQALSDLGIQSSQYDVLDQYAPVANQLVTPLQEQISGLSENLAKQGIQRSNAIPQAMKLKSEYANMFGAQGGIGQLQARTKQYRSRAEELKKQYEDNPLLQRYALSQLQPGEVNLQEGKLQLGNFRDAQMVRNIAEEDILDRLNDAASKLKPSDISRTGIQFTGQLGSFNDLYSIAQKQGVSAERVNNLVASLLSKEELLSIGQLARATGEDPEIALKKFLDKAQGIASSNVSQTTSYRDFNIENEAGKALMTNTGLDALQLPGARMEVQAANSFMNAKYENGKLTIGEKISNDPSGIMNAKFYDSQGREVTSKEAVQSYRPSSSQSETMIPVLKPGYKRVTQTEQVNQKIESEFLQLKQSNPVLRNMSNEKALEHVQNYYKNLGQVFSSQDVFKTNFEFVKSSLTGAMPVSTFINTKGQQKNLSQLADEYGMTEDEIVKSFTPTGVGIRPNIGTVVEGSIVDQNGKKVNIFMEPDQRSKALGSTANSILTHIYNGGDTGEVMTPYVDSKTGEALVGVRTFIINDYNGEPLVLSTTSDQINQKVLESMAQNKSKAQIQNMFEKGAAKVQTLGEVINEATTGVRVRLQGNKY